MRAVVFAVLASACGRLGFDPTGDAGTSIGDADDAPADVAIDMPGGAFVCGDLAQMADDFNDGITDPAKWSRIQDPGMTVGESGGVARITLASSDPAFRYGHFLSVCTYDGRGRRIVMRVGVTPLASPTVEMAFCMTHFDTMARQVCFDFVNDRIAAIYNSGSNPTTLTSRPFNLATDRYWSLRQQGTQVHWETSANGTTWSPFHAALDPTDISAIRVELFSGTFGAVTNPGVSEYDEIAVQ